MPCRWKWSLPAPDSTEILACQSRAVVRKPGLLGGYPGTIDIDLDAFLHVPSRFALTRTALQTGHFLHLTSCISRSNSANGSAHLHVVPTTTSTGQSTLSAQILVILFANTGGGRIAIGLNLFLEAVLFLVDIVTLVLKFISKQLS